MFPHQRIKPKTALSNPKFRWCETHLGAKRFLAALGRVFRLLAKYLVLLGFTGSVQVFGEIVNLGPVRNGYWHKRRIFGAGRNSSFYG